MHEDDKKKVKGTLLTHETPFTPDSPHQYEYPFPDKLNKNLYEKYRAEAEKLNKVIICGRLGEYRYYDMDQAIGRAMNFASDILKKFNIAEAKKEEAA
jgi:UDP-galactopyranose mutase